MPETKIPNWAKYAEDYDGETYVRTPCPDSWIPSSPNEGSITPDELLERGVRSFWETNPDA
jgi:hypothetical protein